MVEYGKWFGKHPSDGEDQATLLKTKCTYSRLFLFHLISSITLRGW